MKYLNTSCNGSYETTNGRGGGVMPGTGPPYR